MLESVHSPSSNAKADQIEHDEKSLASQYTKSTHERGSAVRFQAATPTPGRKAAAAGPGNGRNALMNKTTAATSRTLVVRKASKASAAAHVIPDVMNQKNVGNVINMLQTAESLLDKEYEKSDFMQALKRRRSYQPKDLSPTQKVEKVKITGKISMLRKILPGQQSLATQIGNWQSSYANQQAMASTGPSFGSQEFEEYKRT